ncbi:hypothetical protein QYS46_04930 [Klebsiella michiganensis]|nr:hypothetical protein [Klebsiella michiganensis]
MQSLMPPVDAPNNEFSDGNPSLGTLGTVVRALFLNNVQDAIRSVQRELLSILIAANINPDGDSNNQVLQAINKIMVDSNMSVPYGIPLPWYNQYTADRLFNLQRRVIQRGNLSESCSSLYRGRVT